MLFSTNPSEWHPQPGTPDKPSLFQRIYTGRRAENTYRNKQQPWAEHLVSSYFGIENSRDKTRLAKRALKAVIRSLRHGNDPSPELVKRMVQDQAFVYRYQRGDIDGPTQLRYEKVAFKFARKHMYLFLGSSLVIEWEKVSKQAVDECIAQIKRPDFVLTSSLTTYLISILKHKIYAWVRSQKNPYPQKRSKAVSDESDNSPNDALIYFPYAHRIIAQKLGLLTTQCQQLILRYYQIDRVQVERIGQMAGPDPTLSDAVFRERFAVGMALKKGETRPRAKLDDLGIGAKQLGKRRRRCLDQLVMAVIPALLGHPGHPLPDDVKSTLEERIQKARHRLKNK